MTAKAKHLIWGLLILCFLLFLFGCDGEFTVSEKELDLKVGQSAAL